MPPDVPLAAVISKVWTVGHSNHWLSVLSYVYDPAMFRLISPVAGEHTNLDQRLHVQELQQMTLAPSHCVSYGISHGKELLP
jgi:hypothetical protein